MGLVAIDLLNVCLKCELRGSVANMCSSHVIFVRLGSDFGVFSSCLIYKSEVTMSAWILCAVALCVCASGCDMVPPVKMVNQTSFSEPIPVRKTTVEACNACISVAKCEPLWKLVSQWCAAWNNTLDNTDLVPVHPSFSEETQSFQISAKLIVKTQILTCIPLVPL